MMKKLKLQSNSSALLHIQILKITVLVILYVLVSMFSLSAQTPRKDSGADGQMKAKDITENGLHIGDYVPDLSITPIHNYKSKSAKLSDFKGKLLILDFWATWCSPCVAMIPKMEELQKEFKNKVQFISITDQKAKDVLAFISKLDAKCRGDIPVVTDDKLLSSYFPHVYLPHYVWIDAGGKVIAFTGAEEISRDNIIQVLEKDGNTNLKRKHDYKIEYDYSDPLFIGSNGGIPTSLNFYSVLTGYQSGLSSIFTKAPLKDSTLIRLTFTNDIIPHLFGGAFGGNRGEFSKKNMRFLVKDTTKLLPIGDMVEWAKKNTYCYELILPKSRKAEKYAIMKDELNRFFPQYEVYIQKELSEVLALVRLDTIDRIETGGGKEIAAFSGVGFELRNASIKWISQQLGMIYLQNHPLPIVDDTGYAKAVDIKIEAKMSDVGSLNQALAKYGLALQKKHKEIEVLVFKDR
ncbi:MULTISPECIES: TlpA family protein disulfide reductase [Sphingobacterium]|uniref:TlpA family protein disulfide reductase n=1 Tax=Sphingobacterium TaxID=28453 RepID=UPI00257DB9A1|nr:MULTISPECIES: TlpA disulfide reductase family protein [Sphingobacterium]